ncbi:MAG: hypothetical protein ACAI34_09390, partial [Verrucomicrobium sp.]
GLDTSPPKWIPLDLAVVLALALIVRVLFWPSSLVGMDAIGFAVGGLGTWAAHPPGYFGICFTAWLINHLLHNIKDSIVLMNVAASLVAIIAIYRLAQWLGLSRVWTVLCTASYAFSIVVLYNSIVPLSYATEAMFGALVGWLSFVAMHTKARWWAILATAVWAASGFYRQTSCFVLAPLIAFMVLKVVPWRLWLVHALIALAICGAWVASNSYYMNASTGIRSTASFAGSVWSTQIMMQSSYDPATLAPISVVEEGTGNGFHWPGVELLAWADDRLGTHILPDWRQHSPDPPSPSHALRFALVQFVKVGYFLLLSLPALVLIIPVIGSRILRSGKACGFCDHGIPRVPLWVFLGIWTSPALLLYIFGQMGPPGYLLVILPAWVVGVAVVCSASALNARQHSLLARAHGGLTAIGAAFFCFASPFQLQDTPTQQMADLAALQYTGKAITRGYFISRSILGKPTEQRTPDWKEFNTDREIVAWWRATNPESKALHPPVATR